MGNPLIIGSFSPFPSPFTLYETKVQPKGAPSPPHSTGLQSSPTLFPLLPLRGFALDFPQNQHNHPNDPQTEVPMPTPNLTNHQGPISGRENPPRIPRLVIPHLAAPDQGEELQELLTVAEEAKLGDTTERTLLAHLRQKSKPNQAFVLKKKPNKIPKTLFLCWV